MYTAMSIIYISTHSIQIPSRRNNVFYHCAAHGLNYLSTIPTISLFLRITTELFSLICILSAVMDVTITSWYPSVESINVARFDECICMVQILPSRGLNGSQIGVMVAGSTGSEFCFLLPKSSLVTVSIYCFNTIPYFRLLLLSVW